MRKQLIVPNVNSMFLILPEAYESVLGSIAYCHKRSLAARVTNFVITLPGKGKFEKIVPEDEVDQIDDEFLGKQRSYIEILLSNIAKQFGKQKTYRSSINVSYFFNFTYHPDKTFTVKVVFVTSINPFLKMSGSLADDVATFLIDINSVIRKAVYGPRHTSQREFAKLITAEGEHTFNDSIGRTGDIFFSSKWVRILSTARKLRKSKILPALPLVTKYDAGPCIEIRYPTPDMLMRAGVSGQKARNQVHDIMLNPEPVFRRMERLITTTLPFEGRGYQLRVIVESFNEDYVQIRLATKLALKYNESFIKPMMNDIVETFYVATVYRIMRFFSIDDNITGNVEKTIGLISFIEE